jgi:hypothetical protein
MGEMLQIMRALIVPTRNIVNPSINVLLLYGTISFEPSVISMVTHPISSLTSPQSYSMQFIWIAQITINIVVPISIH